MWSRDDARPTTYNGVRFRSGLEAKVAEQLDVLNVAWAYEAPVDTITWYLPDFTIAAADPGLELTRWVEVKPAEALYALRDKVGCPELFTGTHDYDVDAKTIHDAGIEELWKPKRLAEVTGAGVLVVYAINRTRSLSILMRPDGIQLSRCHPAVNQREVIRKREWEAEQERWRAEYEQRQAEREAQRKAEEVERRQILLDHARASGRPARYDSACWICGALVIFPASRGWAAVCRDHLTDAEAPS